MVFIYWGWDTAVSVNEETKDKNKTPGRAAILSTFILLVTYALVIFSMQSFAGIKTTGNGLGNPANAGDVLSVQGSLVFGTAGLGSFLTHLLLLMVLSSAAASTQTTILPTARTTLSMAVYKAIPSRVLQDPPALPHPDGVHPRHGRHLDRRLRGVELHVQRHRRDRRRGDRDRPVHRLLLRADRLRLRLVLPAQPHQQRAQPVDAGHPAGRRRADPVLPRRLEHVAGLRRGHRERLHDVDGARASTGRSAARS